MKQLDRAKFIIGLIVLFGGLNLTILLSHLSRFYGIAMVFAGICILLWASRGAERDHSPVPKRPKNLASDIIHLLTFNGKFRDAIPIAGIGVLTMVATYNLLVSRSPYLGSNDFVAIFLGAVLISYNLVPKKYSVERDFALLFSILLFVFLVIPTTVLQFTSTGDDTNSPITYYLLAKPTAILSGLLGVSVISPSIHPVTGLLAYNMMEITGPEGFPIPLSISLSCSGLYSVAIFVSAFIAFVAVEYRKFDGKVAILLGLGILLAWIANIIRMTIIVLVGYYKGAAAMVWTHNNIGELIFMAWVALFWWFMFRYFGVLDSGEEKIARPRKRNGKCAVCGQPLSPTIPSTRCECGAISHSSCILTEGMRCPSCGVEMDADSETY
jgi:archaeosortase C (PEF-CTERM variant)